MKLGFGSRNLSLALDAESAFRIQLPNYHAEYVEGDADAIAEEHAVAARRCAPKRARECPQCQRGYQPT